MRTFTPKVSVIIPTYNRSSLVKEAVKSVLAQTFKDFEVIVIDDGSTDDTRNVIEGIGDGRVKYFHKQNGGVSSARNLGLSKANSVYVAFLDSDDLWPENFLEVMLRELQKNPDYSAAYCARTLLYPDGRKVESHNAKYCESGWITRDLFRKTFIQTSTICLRRIALQKFSFDKSLRNAEDSDAWLKLSTEIQFLFVPDIQVVFRADHRVTPRRDSSSINCNRIRVLERFYYRLGGYKFVPKNIAKRKLSHAYRSVAKNYYQRQCRSAAICLYKRAARYLPLDIRLYWGLLQALLLKKKDDRMPDWQMPEPLPANIR
jgi:glycosyltransferase involved in cell wall biosynthesis